LPQSDGAVEEAPRIARRHHDPLRRHHESGSSRGSRPAMPLETERDRALRNASAAALDHVEPGGVAAAHEIHKVQRAVLLAAGSGGIRTRVRSRTANVPAAAARRAGAGMTFTDASATRFVRPCGDSAAPVACAPRKPGGGCGAGKDQARAVRSLVCLQALREPDPQALGVGWRDCRRGRPGAAPDVSARVTGRAEHSNDRTRPATLRVPEPAARAG